MVLGHLLFKIESQNINTFINKVSTGLTETHQIQMINVSIDCVHLITSCLNPNRLNRIAFPAHPWISRKGRQPVDFDLTDNAAILHRAAHIFCQKFKFQVPKTPRPSSYILSYIAKHPYQRTGGCFNLIVESIKAEMAKAPVRYIRLEEKIVK